MKKLESKLTVGNLWIKVLLIGCRPKHFPHYYKESIFYINIIIQNATVVFHSIKQVVSLQVSEMFIFFSFLQISGDFADVF